MALFYKGLCYTAAPKTASSWFEELLRASIGEAEQRCGKHSFRGMEDWTGPVATTIRHPVSWLASCYARMRRGSEMPGPSGKLCQYMAEDFEWFVDNVPAGLVGEIFGEYTSRATHVIRVEKLDSGAWVLLFSLGKEPRHYEIKKLAKGRTELKRVAGYPSPINVSADKVKVTKDVEAMICEKHADFIGQWYKEVHHGRCD